ncbi:uncharacterized protein NEMAJ01_0720 [Nematocida major]|uniref:uncharacterized protein n=1 Tax=Nematocida major TaxID=1912982 RepID=UPI002007B71E|nr:uncharacterized protein NEMAJ01_0720 [Nematocida major]KAH9385824.1 hypothetical protein NEMAJ01_0720 [Nematocida major]
MILPGDGEYRAAVVRPTVNSLVTAVVEYVAQTHAILRIKMVNGVPSINSLAILHREDALYGIKDSAKMNRLFSTGDTVYGRIVSFSDSGHAVIATAEETQGVVRAVDFSTLLEIKRVKGKFVQGKTVLERKAASIGI